MKTNQLTKQAKEENTTKNLNKIISKICCEAVVFCPSV